jgi:hypothetical protein
MGAVRGEIAHDGISAEDNRNGTPASTGGSGNLFVDPLRSQR